MLRKHENSVSWKAGLLAIGVHVVLLVAMLVSFNWKAAHTVLNVTEVELWDKLPAPQVLATPKPELKPIIEEKPEPKPETVVEEKPEPKPEEPKADIELEKNKKELEEKEKVLKKLAQQTREEDLSEKTAAEKQEKLERDKGLRKLKEDMLNEDSADDVKASSAANAGIIAEYKYKIQAKIRGNVNKSLCGDGNPELNFKLDLLPTGELNGNPKLTKSSGILACDEAVERAIMVSEPLPLPHDKNIAREFRDLNLTFTPNKNN
jgi:colicin import membrane protein